MSLFGTQLPAATAPTGFSTTWNYGAQPAGTTTTQLQSALSNFTSPFAAASPFASTSSSVGSTVPTLSGFGQPQQQPQPSTTASAVTGLGGTRGDVNLSGTQLIGASQSVKTPKETDVIPAIAQAVETLKQKIKENRDLAEEVASVDTKVFEQLDSSYHTAHADYGKALSGVQKTLRATKALRAESRRDLLDGEMAHRLRDNLAINFDYGAPLNYLLRLATDYEKLIAAYAEELNSIEKLVFGQQKPVSAEDIAAHLKRVDTAFRYVTAQVYELDKKVEELKDSFKDYRRLVYGDATKFFADGPTSVSTSSSRFGRVEGPSPFSSSSNSALLIVASALSRAQAGAGLVPNINLPVQQQPFGSQPLVGFGLQQQQPLPFSATQALFRPFGAATGAPIVTTSATPFASGALSFASALGATTSTAASMTTSTTVSPWRFSSPFNTSSSGTLFGGTATNVGAVKPLGLATPLQQGGSPASLQLLNPPLGSKRGKS